MGIGLSARATVHKHVNNLVALGRLRRNSRGEIVASGRAVSLAGSIRAGGPSESCAVVEDVWGLDTLSDFSGSGPPGPASADGVFAVEGRVVNQAHINLLAIRKIHHTLQKLAAVAAAFRAVIKVHYEAIGVTGRAISYG